MNTGPETAKEQVFAYSPDLVTFVDTHVLTLYREGGFLSAESITSLAKVNPLINLLLKSASEAMADDPNKQLEIGGSVMEQYTGLMLPEEYWAAKKQLKNVYQNHEPEINKKKDNENWREKAIRDSFGVVANGDPDIDLYMSNETHLPKTFSILHSALNKPEISKTDNGGAQFTTSFGETARIKIGFGPVSKTNHVKRLYLQLYNQNEQPIFHIDLTSNAPTTGSAKAVNRRHQIGPIHDLCRGKVMLVDSENSTQGIISYDPQAIPDPNKAAILNLENKDIAASIEGMSREERKIIGGNVSKNNIKHWDEFALTHLFSLLDPNDIFTSREQTSDPRYSLEKIIEAQAPQQQRILYQELYLMAQYDPFRTVILLQDTGLDKVFFGRHLTRRETHQILRSSYFKYEMYQDVADPTAASRKGYINLDINDPERNGCERLICAIGEVFGANKRTFASHFSDGLGILRDPSLLPEIKLPKTMTETSQIMAETIRDWGGLTETGLHRVLSNRFPDRFPNENEDDRQRFRQKLIELKKTGTIETARRKLFIEGEENEVRFYYVCSNPVRIEKIVPDESIIPACLAPAWIALLQSDINTLEAIMSFNQREHELLSLKDENGNNIDYSYVQEVLTFLINHQQIAEKTQKLKSWVNPETDD